MRVLLRSQLVICKNRLYSTHIPRDLNARSISLTANLDDFSWIAVYVIGLKWNTTLFCTLIQLPRPIIHLQRRQHARRRLAVAMAFHPCLGAGSALRVVDAAVVGAMVCRNSI